MKDSEMSFSELRDKATKAGYLWDDRFVMFYHPDAKGPAWEVALSVEQMEDILKEQDK